MRVLITGATGFVASQIVATLHEAGHEVICCVRNVAQARERFWYADTVIACDFNRDTTADIWLTRLRANKIDAVINCVGVLQGSYQQNIQAIHKEAPCALFEACAQAQIKRVIHISALGAGEVDTSYAQTKQAADDALLSHKQLSCLILRPSVIYSVGSYGGTSLFRGLSALPGVIPCVGRGDQRMAPIYLPELARAVLYYLEHPDISHKIIYAVGAEEVSQKNMLIQLRRWLGSSKALCLPIPKKLIGFFAKFGDWIEKSPLNSTTMKMLEYNNIADPKPFFASIPFRIRGFSDVLATLPSSTQDRWHAKLYFLRPLLRVCLAFLWIISGVVPFLNPEPATALLAQLPIPESALTVSRLSLSSLDIAIGLAILLRWHIQLIGWLQVVIIFIYTLTASIAIPAFWLAPLGPLTKNIPILVAVLIWMAIEDDR